ncbi:MAG: amidase [Fimbriiglobus sp.]
MAVDRRELLLGLGVLGIGTATFQRALLAQERKTQRVTTEMVEKAEWIAGVSLKAEEREAVAAWMTATLQQMATARKTPLANSVPLALHFQPRQGSALSAPGDAVRTAPKAIEFNKPASDEDLAYLGIRELGHLLRSKQISSVELTKFFLARLHKYNPMLLCAVTILDDIALSLAKKADDELAQGQDRGPLHGIPWGAKDLMAYPGAPTTWGTEHFKKQTLDTKATVATKLEVAGAVLVAKLTLGALAWGDQWFGGMTRNPWSQAQGSSGSSAGSASAVCAGLVPFAIGSETLGSIVSPSTRCGVTGLRPTFGRVSRAGCMTLAWSMDKLGPMARSIDDVALVFAAIHGADPADAASVDRPFVWPAEVSKRKLRVGYIEATQPVDKRPELQTLRELGYELVPIELPGRALQDPLKLILDVECAAAFDDVTAQGVREGLGLWPSTFQRGRFVSAVDYLRANRHRSLLMEAMAKVMKMVDVYVGGNDLFLTNMTGHPSVCIPNGFREAKGSTTPSAITFTGQLDGETTLLQVAEAYQNATGHHKKRPPLDRLKPTSEEKK